MFPQSSPLSYQQKGWIAEFIYLLVIGVLSPLAVGLQIFDQFSFTLSLVLLNILQLPVIMLFYRVYLPFTIGKSRYLLATVLFPLYVFIYEIGSRLCSLAMIHLPFVPSAYRAQLESAHPGDFSGGYFNQSLGYTCLVLLAASSLYVVKLLFREKHHLQTVKTEKLQLELDQLKAQIQPHFFFNTLNNIYSLSVHQSKDTPRMIEGLSAIMRYVLYDCSQEKVSLEKEVAFLNNYVALEKLRHPGKELIELNIQGEVSGIFIEPLLLMPLVENSFKYGLYNQLPEKWVRLVLSVDEEELIFQASNVQVPDAAREATDYGGIGLKNLRKRLKLLYPGSHELTIYDERGIFTVTLILRFA